MEEQIQQLINLTEKGLTQMATQMNVSLPQLWEILIRQQYVEAAQSLIVFGIILIPWIIIFQQRKKIIEFGEEYFPTIIMPFTLLCIVTFVSIFCFFKGIGQIINPEYYAIQDVTEFISEITNN